MRTAIEIADTLGLENLSIRKLAQACHVEAMSLYRYFASKDDLLAAMLEQLLAELAPDRDREDQVAWYEHLRAAASGLRRLNLAHPCLAALMTFQVRHTPAMLNPVGAALDALSGAGFSPAQAVLAYRSVLSYVLGALLTEDVGVVGLTCCTGPSALPDAAAPKSANIPASRRLPMAESPLSESLSSAADPEADAAFDFGLDLVIEGLRRFADVPSHERGERRPDGRPASIGIRP